MATDKWIVIQMIYGVLTWTEITGDIFYILNLCIVLQFHKFFVSGNLCLSVYTVPRLITCVRLQDICLLSFVELQLQI